jgi:hypothetical protein
MICIVNSIYCSQYNICFDRLYESGQDIYEMEEPLLNYDECYHEFSIKVYQESKYTKNQLRWS